MNPEDSALVIAQYNDAIDKLEKYQAKEPKQQARDDASAKIADYRNKIIDEAWRSVTSRTDALNALVADLKAITDKASNVPQLADAIGKLKDVAKTASDLAKSQTLKCKTCNADIVVLPNALAAIVAAGGKKKITLTCKNGHTNEYEIAAP